MIRFSQLFLDVITSLSVIERHLCETAAFIVSDTALFNRFLSKVDWVFEKAIIIAVTYENSGVYLISQLHLADASKVEEDSKISGEKGLNRSFTRETEIEY